MKLFFRQKSFALALALVTIACGIIVQSANANLMFDIRQDSAGTFASSNFGRSITIPSNGGTDVMDLYALINDGSAANGIPAASSSPSNGVTGATFDTLGAVQGLGYQFAVAGGTVGAFGFNTAVMPQSGAVLGSSYGAGSAFTASNGASGWGGTGVKQTQDTTDIYANAYGSGNVNYLSGVAGSSGDTGFTEFLIGTFDVAFAASAGSNSLLVNLSTQGLAGLNWGEATSSTTTSKVYIPAKTTAHAVGGGTADNTWMFAPVSFTPAGGSSPTGSSSLAASLTLSQTSAYLYGSTGTANLSVTNSGGAALTLTGSALSNLTGSLATSYGSASTSPNILTLATSVPFGWNTAGGTLYASGATGGTVASVSQTYNVVGVIAPGSNHTFGITGTGALIQGGASFAGVATTESTIGSYGVNGFTSATLLAGSAASTLNPTMAWRTAQSGVDKGSGGVPLISDIVSINGLGSGTVPTYALQVTYDPTVLGSADTAANIAAGSLYLGTRNTTTGTFGNAAYASNTGTAIQPGADAVSNSPLTFASFISSVFPGTTPSTISQADLNLILGSWGVDTLNHAAWAVVNYDADFGVVPEPSTFALLGAAIGAMALAYSRRRKVVLAV